MSKPRVLLMEDELVIRRAFEIILNSSSYHVDVASNGQEGLDFCSSNKYDLILLDLMMPVLDGVGFLEQVKPADSMPDTRIIVLSNLSSGELIKRSLELGAHDSYIKANLGPGELLKLVETELGK